jgi:hypothetical protein
MPICSLRILCVFGCVLLCEFGCVLVSPLSFSFPHAWRHRGRQVARHPVSAHASACVEAVALSSSSLSLAATLAVLLSDPRRRGRRAGRGAMPWSLLVRWRWPRRLGAPAMVAAAGEAVAPSSSPSLAATSSLLLSGSQRIGRRAGRGTTT